MMKKYKNKKGFTLIELIVVIGIVAALSVTMGISFVNTLEDTQKKEYKETYDNIFDAAKLYSKLKVVPETCEETASKDYTCGSVDILDIGDIPATGELPTEKKLSLCCLVESGLLDDKIFKTVDPASDEKEFFNVDKNHFWIVKNTDGEYIAVSNNNGCGLSENIYSNNLKHYDKWLGECD